MGAGAPEPVDRSVVTAVVRLSADAPADPEAAAHQVSYPVPRGTRTTGSATRSFAEKAVLVTVMRSGCRADARRNGSSPRRRAPPAPARERRLPVDGAGRRRDDGGDQAHRQGGRARAHVRLVADHLGSVASPSTSASRRPRWRPRPAGVTRASRRDSPSGRTRRSAKRAPAGPASSA